MELAQTGHLDRRFSLVSKNIDVVFGFAIICILLIMIMPVSPVVLDLFLTLNITFSLMILLVGVYVLKPLEFSAFPSILLLATLFRLALNIASTRLILLNGEQGTHAAGKVIMAFGSFVVGGNYVVGLIVFIILVVVNFVVITKGAGRIAEVAARFTLDAMPGKQMSIDADLNAGLIDENEARSRRQLIARESEYYGAMDGANKFVRGDAIAGIIITLINIVAGFGIGVFQKGLSFGEAAQNYTLLTVGDGLVSQMPALIVSTAAGLVVSRAGAETNLGMEIGMQMFKRPRVLAVTCAILVTIGLIPGLPTVPFLVLASLVGAAAYVLFKTPYKGDEGQDIVADARAGENVDHGADNFKPLPPLDVLGLEIGYGLIPLVDSQQDGEMLDRIKSIRRQIAQELGIVMPSIHIQDNMQFKPGEYSIKLRGNEVARGELMLNSLMAMNPGNAEEGLKGIATKEPTYGIDAFWIKEHRREEAISKGYTIVDPVTVMTTHLSEIIRRFAHELIGRQEVQNLLDALRETHPRTVDELMPNHLSLGGVLRVLQNLLKEQVPIRDLLTIIEALADWAPSVKHLDMLTEHVRQALSRTITRQHMSPDGDLVAISLGHSAERRIAESIQRIDQGDYLSMDPRTAQRLMQRMAEQFDKCAHRGLQPLLLCSGQIRHHVKKLVDRFIPHLIVLSYEEILPSVRIQTLGVAELTDED